MNNEIENIGRESRQALEEWIVSCTRGGQVARNTVCVGIVVLDHLLQNCPVSREDVISPGGEIKGARSGLGNILERYGVQRKYLKEVTTRQGHQDGQRLFEAFAWGSKFSVLSVNEREHLLLDLIGDLSDRALQWLGQQNLKLDVDRRQSPAAWVSLIVENARQRSGGVVEQHLVGAKLEKRFKGVDIPNHPAHAGDRQTARAGDFIVSRLVYHVTANPSGAVIQKCAENSAAGLHPILLTPHDKVSKAIALAEDQGTDKELTVISIESFVAMNIIELATEENKDFFAILQDIIRIYNRRLAEVETNLSLRIEVR